MSNTDAVIFGCGPAGLLAAQACGEMGLSVAIYSKKVKSQIRGAQFLHIPIKDITKPEPDAIIDMRKWGSQAGYATKVYGDPEAPVSWGNYDGPINAWSLHGAYELLWDLWEPHITDQPLDADLLEWSGDADLCVSTVPLPVLAEAWGDEPEGGFNFTYQDVWIRTGLNFSLPHDTVVYNGNPEDHWYRASRIFGWASMEFPTDTPGTVRVRKPLTHDVPDEVAYGVLRVGRYGAWEKKGLVHDGYKMVMEYLK